MERLFEPDFWTTQVAVVTNAPWTIAPLLLLAAVAAWKMKGIIDDGEVRGLKAANKALEAQLRSHRTTP